jgi:hypothetical protein
VYGKESLALNQTAALSETAIFCSASCMAIQGGPGVG